MNIDPTKIKQIEGATYYVSEEPTIEEMALFPLPVNFKVVDPTTQTFQLISYKTDGIRLVLDSGTSAHNDLIEMQGGKGADEGVSGNEFYHLDQATYNGLQNGGGLWNFTAPNIKQPQPMHNFHMAANWNGASWQDENLNLINQPVVDEVTFKAFLENIGYSEVQITDFSFGRDRLRCNLTAVNRTYPATSESEEFWYYLDFNSIGVYDVKGIGNLTNGFKNIKMGESNVDWENLEQFATTFMVTTGNAYLSSTSNSAFGSSFANTLESKGWIIQYGNQ